MKGPIVFAIDIEARGPGPYRHGIISIGVCVGAADGPEPQVLAKRRFDMLPYPHQQMDQRTMDEFWSNHMDILKTLTENAQHPEAQTIAFRNFLDDWSQGGTEPYILCDNPSFDFGMINYYLDIAGLPTLNYDVSGKKYVSTHDADSYARGLMRYPLSRPWMSNENLIHFLDKTPKEIDPEAHNHMPENDAEFIYRLHWYASNSGK